MVKPLFEEDGVEGRRRVDVVEGAGCHGSVGMNI